MLDLFNVLDANTTDYCVNIFDGTTGIPAIVGNIIHWLYLGIQIIVPLLLIIFGMIELAKAITAQKEDEIKKAQSGLLKKAVVAIIVFLVFSLTKFVFNFAQGDEKAWGCANCLIDGDPKKCNSTSGTSVN